MPRKGQKGVLPARNGNSGVKWSSLSAQRQRVFHPSIFYTLSGLPSPNDEPLQDIPSAERAELQELYDEMVCKEKVAKKYAKVVAGIPDGPSLPDYNRRSKKRLEQLHAQV